MAVTAQEHVNPQAPRQAARAARPAPVWTRPSQLRQALPILRLLSVITTIPEVRKVGLLVDGSGIYVRVLMEKDHDAAEAKIFDAERDYLNATPLHNFELSLTPLSRLPQAARAIDLFAGFETVLER